MATWLPWNNFLHRRKRRNLTSDLTEIRSFAIELLRLILSVGVKLKQGIRSRCAAVGIGPAKWDCALELIKTFIALAIE